MQFTECLNLLRQANVVTAKGQINKQAQRMLTSKYQDLLADILQLTNFLEYEADIRDRIFCIMNNVTAQPRCRVCGAITKFNKQKNRFNQYCPNNVGSVSCSMADEDVRARYTDTLVERYGVTTPLQSSEIEAKRRATMLERYGVTHYAQTDAGKVMLKQYVANNRDELTQKRMATVESRYGRKHFAQTVLSDEVYNVLNNKETLTDMLKDFSKTDIAAHLGVHFNLVHRACKRAGITYTPPKKAMSSHQHALTKLVVERYKGPILMDAKSIIPPYELDIYLPDLNLAIEYNGIFFHSEGRGRTRNYHSDKLKMCKQKGIRLIQVWSNEWLQKPEIVKSRIASALGTLDRVYARKCTIVDVATAEERLFLDHNHMQGYVPSSSCYGLVHQGNLVALMSFTKSRYSKTHEWELLRYSTLCNTTVVGGASKLFNHFIRQHSPASIISYCNLRWGTGNMYQQLGFDFNGNSPPNYFYFDANGDTNALMSRVRFQKHKLPHILEHFDSNNTEWENMQAHGFDRIWDCGNGIYSWVGGQ